MNNETLLSICIPTYNRDYILEKCLSKLCPIAKSYNINIFISDNCSQDKTESVVKIFSKKYDNIFYFRQKNNIGPDKNFEYVLKMSTTKYAWLLGDACYINGLDLLLEELKKEDCDLFVVGDVDRVRVGKNVIEKYLDPKLLLKKWGWHLTWLSCLIYNKRIIENGCFERYCESRFLQTGIIFEYFATHQCNVNVNSRITVGAFNLPRRGHWRNIVFEVFCRDWYLFVMSLPIYYSFEEKLYCIKAHGLKSGLFTIQSLLRLRNERILTLKTFCKYRFFIKQTIPLNYCFVCFLSIIPVGILRLYKLMK